MANNPPTNVRVQKFFQSLIEQTKPLTNSFTRYESHESSIEKLRTILKTNKIIVFGSFDRETYINQGSDIDLLLIYKKHEIVRVGQRIDSNKVLSQVQNNLTHQLPRTTNIERHSKAISVKLESSECPIEIVPSYYMGHGGRDNFPIYAIPNGSGGWIRALPQTHNEYINDIDLQNNGRLKKVAKLLKFWRVSSFPKVPISSFYIEMVLASEKSCYFPKSLSACLKNAFVTLKNLRCLPVDDPFEVCAPIPSFESQNKMQEYYRSIDYASKKACSAYNAEQVEDFDEAVREWNLVFNRPILKKGKNGR